MKKLFNIALIFTFVFVLFSAFNTPVLAEENGDPVQRKVIVHYHRYDGEYGDTNLWTWGTGTDGSEAPIAQAGLSDFGMTFEILLGEDADNEIGLIIRKEDDWGSQPTDRDGIVVDGEVPNKSIIVKSGDDFDGFDENGEKHVFVFEGQNHVMYQREEWGPLNEDFGTLSVIYFNPTGEYNGWRVWNWGTGDGGTVATGDGVFPAGRLGIDGQENELFRVWHFQIAANADDEMGFIVKDMDWNKQCADDINIDISDIKGSGHKVVYYQAGACDVTTESFFDDIDLTNFVVEEPELEVEPEEPGYKIIVHYHRWDGNYTTENIWTWNTGTGGSEAPIERSGMSDFGATFEIYLGANASSEIGFILRYGAAWGDGHNDRDGWIPADGGDKPNRAIIVKEDGEFVGFDEDGVKHVFVYEGSNEILYQDDLFGPELDGYGTLAVIYFDPTQEYDEWNIWTWGTDATTSDSFGGGIPWAGTVGVDGMTIGDPVFKVVHLSIGPDAEEVGFIVRTDAWEKQCGDDLFIDVSDIAGGGFKTLFYIAGTCEFIEDFVTFEATANAFEIESLSVIGVQSFTLKFNKPVRVANEEGSIFDAEWFTLTDKDGNVVAIDNINYISGANNVTEFTLFLPENVMLSGGKSPYTITFSREEGEELTYEFSLPSTPPTISIIGGTNITLQVGDTYSLPAFSATELVNGENVPLFNVRVKEGHGYLNTGVAGTYEIIIIAVDRYNNVAERTITITVEGEESGMGALGIVLISVGIAVPVLAGGTVAFLKMRRGA